MRGRTRAQSDDEFERTICVRRCVIGTNAAPSRALSARQERGTNGSVNQSVQVRAPYTLRTSRDRSLSPTAESGAALWLLPPRRMPCQ